MSLKLKGLAYSAMARVMKKKGVLKMRRKFRKLLKTHIEKMSAFRLSMIFMKTNDLEHSLQDVDEKKGVIKKLTNAQADAGQIIRRRGGSMVAAEGEKWRGGRAGEKRC